MILSGKKFQLFRFVSREAKGKLSKQECGCYFQFSPVVDFPLTLYLISWKIKRKFISPTGFIPNPISSASSTGWALATVAMFNVVAISHSNTLKPLASFPKGTKKHMILQWKMA